MEGPGAARPPTRFGGSVAFSGRCCLFAATQSSRQRLRLRDEAMHRRCFGGWGRQYM